MAIQMTYLLLLSDAVPTASGNHEGQGEPSRTLSHLRIRFVDNMSC